MKNGIDISKWQGSVDFQQVAGSEKDFLILREGYRKTVDQRFYEYVIKAKDAGIRIAGVYHFIYAKTQDEATAEAQACIDHVKLVGLGKDTIIFCDFEYDTVTKAKEAGVILGKEECILFSEAFCDYVQGQGYRAGIYTNMDYYRRMYTPDTIAKYLFWLADYSGEPDRACDFHQYSSTGKVPGISGNVDLDRCYMESENQPVQKREPLLAEKVIRIAKEEEGYLEKASDDMLYDKTANAGNKNYTKYGKEMHAIYPEVMDFPAYWCDSYVDWLFYKAYGVSNAKGLLGGNFDDYTVASAQLYKDKGAWHTSDPQLGDQIFFRNEDRICHTGLVTDVDDKYVYTSEGNTFGGSGLIPNGGAVCSKKYLLTNPRIAGYGRPAYDAASGHSPITEGWKQASDGKRWWYQYADGSYPSSGWAWLRESTGGTEGWYLFDREGYMLTGIQTGPDGKKYYLCEEQGIHEGQCMVTDDQGALQIVPYDCSRKRYRL